MGKFPVGQVAVRLLAAVLASGVVVGCASGGFTTTRSVSKFINSKGIILRIVLYIVLWPVLIITMLADEIVFNTIDFWTGKVSAQNKVFEKNGVRVMVAHSLTPLHRSVLTIEPKKGDRTVIELRETATGSVEVYRDGVKRTEVKDIQSAFPMLSLYQDNGKAVASAHVVDLEAMKDLETLSVAEGQAKILAHFGPLGKQVACSR